MHHFVVCGLGRFGLNVVEALRETGRQVTVISDSHTSPDRIDRAKTLGIRWVEGNFCHTSIRREAGVPNAAAVLLTSSNDVDNLEAALEIRGEASEIPVVMRHSDPRFAKRLEASLAIIDKRRPAPNVARVFHVIGDVERKDVVIVDDMVDTAGTLVQSAEALKDNGAQRVFAACTHPILSGNAIERITASTMEKLIVTDTIPVKEETISIDKFVVLSVAELFGEAIRRINKGLSVSSLFT